MRSIETTIVIEASTSKVWGTLMNFENYSSWNPFIIDIQGTAIAGQNLKTQIKIGDKKVQKFKPKVLVVNENEHFRWKGKLFFKGLFDGEHYFIVEKMDDNRTKLIHGENFSGLFSKPILKMIKEDTLKGFAQMNQALKSKVESK